MITIFFISSFFFFFGSSSVFGFACATNNRTYLILPVAQIFQYDHDS